LSFFSFDLEQGFDTLKVYSLGAAASGVGQAAVDGGVDGFFLMTLSGNTLPATITAEASSVYLLFTSDATTQRAGFKLSYVANRPTPAPQVQVQFQSNDFCDGKQAIEAVSGTVSSGGSAPTAARPNGVSYLPNSKCEWVIRPLLTASAIEDPVTKRARNKYAGINDGNMAVRMSFDYFDLEQNYDFLKVYDGADSTAPLLASLTGAGSANCVKDDTSSANCGLAVPTPVQANSGVMYVVFSSDKFTNRNGFTGRFDVVLAATPTPSTGRPSSRPSSAPTLAPYGKQTILSDLRPAYQSTTAKSAFMANDNGAIKTFNDYYRKSSSGVTAAAAAAAVSAIISVDASWILTSANSLASNAGFCQYATRGVPCSDAELRAFAQTSGGENYNYADTCAQTRGESSPSWFVRLDRTYGVYKVRFNRAASNAAWRDLFSVADLVTMSRNTAISVYVGSPCSDEQQKLGLPANLDSYGRCGWTLCGRTTEFAYETVLACTASSYQAVDLRLPEGDWVKLEFTGPESVYQLTLCDIAVWGGVRGFDPNCQGGSCILTPAKYSAAANIEGSVSEASDSGQSNSVLNVLPLALAGVAGVLALALVALGVRSKYVKSKAKTHVEPIDGSETNAGTLAAKKEGTNEWVLESVRQTE